ncbi:MAG: hypothetical protein GXP08_02305 [Gammaproteobacteria bacterium]|nr:hypothetical protein [Gammaproteobacteria bacterium]
MDLHEQDDLRAFLVSLFKDKASKWPMNDKIFNLAYELITESTGCSSAMDYVPKPIPLGREPITWLTKEVRSIFLRNLKDNRHHYATCLKAAAYRMARTFDLAAQGL